MKSTLILALLAAALPAAAQERLPREEALKFAFITSANLKEMLATPIPTDPDVKRAVALREEAYGTLAMPETKLNPDVFSTAGKEPRPVGQLWLHKLVPLADGQTVPTAKLKIVELRGGSSTVSAPCCALAVAKSGADALELLVYGKDKEPVLKTALKPVSVPQENPLELTADRKEDGALLTFRFLGKYEASFMVTDPDLF